MPDPLLRDRPHSTEAERSLVGALLLDPERMIDIVPRIQPRDFYDPINRTIYEAMLVLHEARKPIDFVTISEELKSHAGVQAIGGSAFLATLATNTPTSIHAAEYASIVRDRAVHRELLDVAAAIDRDARNESLSAD